MNSGFLTATRSYHTPQFTLPLELRTKGAVMLMMKVGWAMGGTFFHFLSFASVSVLTM